MVFAPFLPRRDATIRGRERRWNSFNFHTQIAATMQVSVRLTMVISVAPSQNAEV